MEMALLTAAKRTKPYANWPNMLRHAYSRTKKTIRLILAVIYSINKGFNSTSLSSEASCFQSEFDE